MSNQSEVVHIAVTSDTKKALRIAAAENEESMSAFVRRGLREDLEEHGVHFDKYE